MLLHKNQKIITDQELDDIGESKIPKNKQPHIGIEIECLSKHSHFVLKQFVLASGLEDKVQVKSDGSVHSREGQGVELCICDKETEIQNSLRELTDMLEAAKAKVNNTCGLHIHLDMRGISQSKKDKIFSNFVYAQPLLYAINPTSRFRGDYSRPQTYSDLYKAISTGDRDGINPLALERHNTLEIRIHAGSTNYNKIMYWISLLNLIKNYKGTIYNYNTIDDIIHKLECSKDLQNYIDERRKLFKNEKIVTHIEYGRNYY